MQKIRFPRLAPEDLNPRQREVADRITAGPRGEVRGPFLALLHHPDLADSIQQLGEHLRFGTSLPPELVELAVLVTARHWDCQYEWYAHRRIAVTKTALGAEVVEAIARNEAPTSLSGTLRDAHAFCVDVLRHGEPREAAYEAIERQYGKQGVLDLVALCGYYSLLAMVLNTSRVPLPDGETPPLVPLRPLPTGA